MSTYSYCGGCSFGLDAPNIVDAIKGVQTCPECGWDKEVYSYEKEAVAIALLERIERLEAKEK